MNLPNDLRDFREGPVFDLTPNERAVASIAVIVLVLFLNYIGAL